jgi:hypothetical protein
MKSEQILLDMEDHSASEVMTRVCEEDEVAITGYLQVILQDGNMKKEVLRLKGDHAQGFLDLLQSVRLAL